MSTTYKNYFVIVVCRRYAVFTRRNRKIPVLLEAKDTTKILNANLDPRGPFYFISHGFLEGGHKHWVRFRLICFIFIGLFIFGKFK